MKKSSSLYSLSVLFVAILMMKLSVNDLETLTGISLKSKYFAKFASYRPYLVPKYPKFCYHKGLFTNTCKGGLMQKGGPWKFLTLVRGALKKINTDFPLKIEFTCFSMGLTRNFHGKMGGPEIFLRSEGGAPKNFRNKYFLHQAPPYKCLWTVPNAENFPYSCHYIILLSM